MTQIENFERTPRQWRGLRKQTQAKRADAERRILGRSDCLITAPFLRSIVFRTPAVRFFFRTVPADGCIRQTPANTASAGTIIRIIALLNAVPRDASCSTASLQREHCDHAGSAASVTSRDAQFQRFINASPTGISGTHPGKSRKSKRAQGSAAAAASAPA